MRKELKLINLELINLLIYLSNSSKHFILILLKKIKVLLNNVKDLKLPLIIFLKVLTGFNMEL